MFVLEKTIKCNPLSHMPNKNNNIAYVQTRMVRESTIVA